MKLPISAGHNDVALLLRAALGFSIEPRNLTDQGSHILWIGYVLAPETYVTLAGKIRDYLHPQTQVTFIEGEGQVIFGRQAPGALDVKWGECFPPLAFMTTDAVGLPAGTAFAVMHVPLLGDARVVLRDYPRELIDVGGSLMGSPAVRANLQTPRGGAGTGTFYVYFTVANLEHARLR